VRVPWAELPRKRWVLTDVLNEGEYERDGGEMIDPGLFVDLKAWGYHGFRFSPAVA
jgi:hypothetical protein